MSTSPAHSPSPAPGGSTLRHAATPLDKQRVQLEKLLKDPAKPAYIPPPPKDKAIRPAREMMKNVQGSSAGAGSGEFHVYKASRRREYERLKMMDEEAQKVCTRIRVSARCVVNARHRLLMCCKCLHLLYRKRRKPNSSGGNASGKRRQTPRRQRTGQNDRRRKSARRARLSTRMTSKMAPALPRKWLGIVRTFR